jgi:hypothetical protein
MKKNILPYALGLNDLPGKIGSRFFVCHDVSFLVRLRYD